MANEEATVPLGAIAIIGSTFQLLFRRFLLFLGIAFVPMLFMSVLQLTAFANILPDEIYEIPANSPVYNVTYVEVYQSTPEVVYVGYYPGYTHSYVHTNVVVWGTGWWHPGWVGRWYYPRPATWGFHVRWNPWWGWSFGFSWSSGPFTFYVGRGGWWRGGWCSPAFPMWPSTTRAGTPTSATSRRCAASSSSGPVGSLDLKAG